jgi:hypothetical protein|tara:strand:- start:1489 stop:1701 length:213 start_codon:yes stop_codon:yes gene_type:complete
MGKGMSIKQAPDPRAELEAQEAIEAAKFEESQQKLQRAARGGRMSTILTSGSGVQDEANVAKTMLGGTRY